MKVQFKNVNFYKDQKLRKDAECECDLPSESVDSVFLAVAEASSEYGVFPGFCDVHVHFREPGFSYKETIRTGSLAAAHGGYTDVFAMPNLDPVPDSLLSLNAELEIIRLDAVIGVHPYGSLTVGEKGETLSDLSTMAPLAVAFSDDGKGVQSEDMMRRAMEECASLGKVLAAHCEDERLAKGGQVNECAYAKANALHGIPNESEWQPIERDLKLARETGCKYHVCHVSTKESVALLREAKSDGIDVTAETAPHYLLLDDSFLLDDGRFKMNPPLRSPEDREALQAGLADGTIDMIATDHAPHSAAEKAGGLSGSLMGVTGLECAFPMLYTGLVKTGKLPLEKLISLMTDAPRKRFGLIDRGGFCIWDLSAERVLDPQKFLSMGKSTPFAGAKVFADCIATIDGGKTVWLKRS